MKTFDEETAHRLLAGSGLTESEIKAVLHNPMTTMLILPILERMEQIERQLRVRQD